MLSYVVLGLPGLYLLERLGLKSGLRMGAGLTAAGAAVRFLGCGGGRTGFALGEGRERVGEGLTTLFKGHEEGEKQWQIYIYTSLIRMERY
jgi:hypothetical protein